ncbi:MAG: ATP-binding protein, partial [Dermatophilaceae bacterium]
MDAAVTLDIVDDGIGFAAQAQALGLGSEPGTGSGGFGLRSMTSRAAELGGALTVESQLGRGTAISVLFDRAAATSPFPAADGTGEST